MNLRNRVIRLERKVSPAPDDDRLYNLEIVCVCRRAARTANRLATRKSGL
jgi:hypothetical protein